jgi:hypothetical protein
MPNDVLDDAPIEASRSLHNLPTSEKPTIRILLYTDDPQEIVKGPAADLGLGLMINHLEGHPPAFANLSITYEPRYTGIGPKANNKINLVLDNADAKGEPFDQVWVFGLHQVNRQSFSMGVGGGGPESELDKAEISAFERRMDTGLGVLITGDHANRQPPDIVPLDLNSTCDDPRRGDQFLGLGRALGRCIPRAGELRDWEGKPTSQPRFSFNTQVVVFGTNVDTQSGFDLDTTPQQLILQTFNDKGRPSLNGQPHPLFFYRQGQAIQLFPDHVHEGAVVIPESLSARWPKKNNVRPQPRVVAYGLDKRNGNLLKLVGAYDGDFVDVGRIVADSTWHHYFNVNLRGFQHPGALFSPTDQIGQYYRNLALWLTPRRLRIQMAEVMARWIAQQPSIAELVGPRPSKLLSEMMNTGSAAMKLLTEVASACEIHELFQTLVPEAKRRGYEAFYFPEKGFALSPLPSKELLLGALVHGVTLQSTKSIALNSAEAKLASHQSAIAAASELAFKRQKLRVERTARSLQRFVGDTSPSSSAPGINTESNLSTKLNNELSSERSFVMAICDADKWRMTFRLDANPNIVEELFFANLKLTDGVIKGDVEKPLGNKIADLVGTCGPFAGGTRPMFSSISFVFRLKTIGGGAEVGMFMAGLAFLRDDGTGKLIGEFRGRYITFPPDANTPAATKEVEIAAILGTGSGDTGTGTGTQT